MSLNSLRKAAEEAANLTPEAVAAKMSPEEKKRLSRVRNIGIAVCSYTSSAFTRSLLRHRMGRKT